MAMETPPLSSQVMMLEVDVNGEESFIVDKGILCSYSGKFGKLFRRVNSTTSPTRKLKVNFNDFPGGAKSFELLTRFCYNNGTITLTPLNICPLYSAARYMEMDKTVTLRVAGVEENLVQQIEKFLNRINYWSWNELISALKQCDEILRLGTSSSLVQKCFESLVGRLASGSEAASSSCVSMSSSDSCASANRFSCDTKSTDSSKNSLFRVTWWFEDVAFLSTELLQVLVKLMISQKLDNVIVSKFLFFYHRSKVTSAVSDQKVNLTMSIIDSLCLLDRRSISFKSLMWLLSISSNVELEKSCSGKLVSMIGSRLDEATLDNMLMPSPNGMKYFYNVNLALRLVKAFVHGNNNKSCCIRLQNVANVMDMYMLEVAPDPSLKPSKMVALVTALPDCARVCYDGVYRAVDLYIQVHSGLMKEDELRICASLNYNKLSTEACAHLAQNARFPSKAAVGVIISQHMKLKSEVRNVNLECFTSDVVKKSLAMDNVNTDISGMQWRVMELEKLCKNMQNQISKVMKTRPGSHTGMRSLPKLCS